MKATDYQITVRWSEIDQAFLAAFPALPNCMAFGDSPQVAMCEGLQTADLWLEAAVKSGMKIPTPDFQFLEGKTPEQYQQEICKRIVEAYRQLDIARQLAAYCVLYRMAWRDIDHVTQDALALFERIREGGLPGPIDLAI